MALDRSFVERNRASTARIRAMAALSAEALQTRVGQHWTVAILLAHLAFWDRRVLDVLDRLEREGSLAAPSIDLAVNDISLPLWAAIPPQQAAQLAVQAAAELDARLEALAPQRLEEVYAFSRRFVERGLHRGEHLDEADAALK